MTTLCRGANGFLLPPGEGQDEGKEEGCSLLSPLTLALSRRERGLRKTLCPTPQFVPNSIGLPSSQRKGELRRSPYLNVDQ
jgi:hypothetical protein